MKTRILFLITLLVTAIASNLQGQGVESFDNFSPSDWYSGTWTLTNDQVWTFDNCDDFTIYSPTRTLVRFGHRTGTLSTEVSGGLGSLIIALHHLWGETDPPQNMEVKINGQSYGVFEAGFHDKGNGHNDSTTIYTIEDLNKEGNVTIELVGSSNLGLDSVIWTGFIDTHDPSAPGQANGYNIAKNNFSVNWTAATDNSEVASYDVYLDGDFQGNTENTYFDITGLDPGQSYSVTMVAIDLSGNRSEPSTPANISTLPADAPGIGAISDISLFLNSGENFILLPEIDDGNPDEIEELTITATSDDNTVVEVLSIEYDNQNTCGYLQVEEKGILGSTTINVEVADASTTIEKTINISVVPYSKPGINFEVHDLVFWKEAVPIGSKPVFDTVISKASGPPPEINWDKMELTVSQDCNASQCDGHDFITLMYRGYLVPPANGAYTFYMEGVGDYGLWLSPDDNFDNAEGIAVKSSSQHEVVGTDQGDGTWASAPQTLEKGKVYAIYGINWTIHTTDGGIKWEGPDISKRYLQGEEIMYVYDIQKPSAPKSVQLIAKATESIRIAWNSSTDNQNIAGYNIYVDGQKYNQQPVSDTSAIFENLSPDTKYTFAITAVDEMGNESTLSPLLTETTYQPDDSNPTPPGQITTDVQESMAIQISWSGASDNQAVFGYNVFVDGELFNTENYIFETSLVIKPLTPDNTYEITIQTIDVGLNESALSSPQTVNTTVFDPDVNTLGVKMGRLTIEMNPVGLSQGLGINPKFADGEFKETIKQEIIDDLNPGLIRWGTITANELRFDNYIGNDKVATIADFANLCIENNAYMSFTCGMDESTDWIQDENTFLHFLEYLGGSSSSTYGAIRAAEGYEEPLLNQLPGLFFEFGNEVWGADVHFAPIGDDYSKYANWARETAELMKSSDYYNEELMKFTYSGRNPNPNRSYGLNKKLLNGDQGDIELLALGGYIGSNFDGADIDQGNSYLDYFKNSREDGLLDIQGLDYYNKLSISLTGEFKPTYFYESNTKNDTYNGRVGHAMIITDYWLSALEKGAVTPTIYSLSHGQWRIISPGENFKRLPVFKTAKYFNTHCRGHILETNYNSQSKISDADGNQLDWDAVGTYAYSSGENFSIVFISRDFENDHFVEIDLPDDFNFQQTAKQYIISGDDYSTFDATVDSSDISLTDNYLVTVPKYSMVLITFSGDNQNFESVPPGYFVYDKITDIELTAETTEIIENKGQIAIEAITTPEDDFIGEVNWEITQGDIDVNLVKFDKTCYIKGGGNTDDNGKITLRASALDDVQVFDEIEITISGQGETGIFDRQNDKVFQVYPNPSRESFSLKLNQSVSSDTRIWVCDLSGRKVLELRKIKHSNILQFGENLQNGVYILNYKNKNERLNRMIIKQE